MSSQKQRNLTRIIREFVKDGDSYDITGINLGLAKFFWRETQELFMDLATGDYRIDTSSGQQILIITNTELLGKLEAIQVGYTVDFDASKYETQWNVDVNILKDKYNQLVDTCDNLWEYVRLTGFISDDTSMDLILPELSINEIWVRGEFGYVAMPIDDVGNRIKEAIQKYLTEVVYPQIDNYIETVSKIELDRYVEQVKKPQLDNFTDVKEEELQALKDILAGQLQELVDNALADRGVIPNGTDWNTLSYGTWYVADLNGSGYINHPQLDADENIGIVLVTDSQGGNAKVIRYYSMKKRMHFKIKNNIGVWSEWSTLSEGGGVRYEYNQPNHGFMFTPVMLDGVTNQWVRATHLYGADGIAVYKDANRFELLLNGSVQIPVSARDSKGDQFIADEFYFLSNDVAGGLDRAKPIHVFQPLMRTYVDEQDRMWAEVGVDTPVNLNPRILIDEMNSLGIQMQEDTGLHTESKSVVGAINENKSRIEGIETDYQPASVPTLTTTAKTIEGAINELDRVIQEGKSNDKVAMNITRVGGICFCMGHINTPSNAIAPFSTSLTFANVNLRPNVAIICPFGSTDGIIGALGVDGVLNITVGAGGLGITVNSQYRFAFMFEPAN